MRAPDAREWQRKHGVSPFVLPVPEGRDIAPQLAQAAELSGHDWSLLDARKVHQIQSVLETLCEATGFLCGLKGEDWLVFFEPSPDRFLVYPLPA